MNFGIGEWLRGRLIAWLAGSGGAGIVLVVDGAQHVTVRQAGTVDVAGGYVVARGCKVVQDSTGEKIQPQTERIDESSSMQILNDEIKYQQILKSMKIIEQNKSDEINKHARNAMNKRRKKTIDVQGWEMHNVGSNAEE